MFYYKIVEVKEGELDLGSADFAVSEEKYNLGSSVVYDNGHLEIEYIVYQSLTEKEYIDQAISNKHEDI